MIKCYYFLIQTRVPSALFSQKYVWKGELNSGTYSLLPFTTGCKLKRRNKKNVAGKSVELVYRTDTGELDLTRELRSVSVWTCVYVRFACFNPKSIPNTNP